MSHAPQKQINKHCLRRRGCLLWVRLSLKVWLASQGPRWVLALATVFLQGRPNKVASVYLSVPLKEKKIYLNSKWQQKKALIVNKITFGGFRCIFFFSCTLCAKHEPENLHVCIQHPHVESKKTNIIITDNSNNNNKRKQSKNGRDGVVTLEPFLRLFSSPGMKQINVSISESWSD